jgi:hypothetical protein
MSDWEKTGYIPVDEGFCDFRACGNHYYLTACGNCLQADGGLIMVNALLVKNL